MKSRHKVLAALSIATLIVALQSTAFAQKKLANVVPQGMGIRFEPTISYTKVTLTVSGPTGVMITESFDGGVTPTLTLFTKKGARLPEGTYTYELSFAPVLNSEVKQALASARDKGNEALVTQ